MAGLLSGSSEHYGRLAQSQTRAPDVALGASVSLSSVGSIPYTVQALRDIYRIETRPYLQTSTRLLRPLPTNPLP